MPPLWCITKKKKTIIQPTFAISSPAKPKPSSRPVRLRRRAPCKTAFDSGTPRVMATVVVRYIKEMAGARWDGSWAATTACSETKTADWAVPVPKPLVERVSRS